MRLLKLSFFVGAMAALLGADAANPPKRNAAVAEGLPYCFVEEQADKRVAERIGHITPIGLNSVLLFPVVENGVIRGKRVRDGLGSPVLYMPGSDLNTLVFKGVERWPVKRYMVWARGYYLEGIPRIFLYSDNVLGKRCYLVELTPIKPGTDVKKLEAAVISELKRGEITVGPEAEITDKSDFGELFRASAVESWMVDPLSGYRRGMVNWGTPGAEVEFRLTDEDFKLVESYLRGADTGSGTNAPSRAEEGDRR